MSSEEVMREVIQDAQILRVRSVDRDANYGGNTNNYTVDVSRLWNNFNPKYKKFKLELLSIQCQTDSDLLNNGSALSNVNDISLYVNFGNSNTTTVSTDSLGYNCLTILKNKLILVAPDSPTIITNADPLNSYAYSSLSVQSNSAIISRPGGIFLNIRYYQGSTQNLSTLLLTAAGGEIPQNALMFRITPLI